MTVEQTEPCLYIIMRSDLESLNPGKAMAQAAHAANAFAHGIQFEGAYLQELYKEWCSSTDQHFGTTIVLDGDDMETIKDALYSIEVNDSKREASYGISQDPTYPVSDGRITHLLPLDICAWVFCDRNNKKVREILDIFPLHR